MYSFTEPHDPWSEEEPFEFKPTKDQVRLIRAIERTKTQYQLDRIMKLVGYDIDWSVELDDAKAGAITDIEEL